MARGTGKGIAECVLWHMATEATSPARLSSGSRRHSGMLMMVMALGGRTMTEVSGDVSGAAVANGPSKRLGGGILVKLNFLAILKLKTLV